MDPLDMSYSRFLSLYGQIGNVSREFEPKTQIQLALEAKEAEIKAHREQHGNAG